VLCCDALWSLSVEDIFAAIENDPEPSATKYLVRASYLQIYNEVREAAALSPSAGRLRVLAPAQHTGDSPLCVDM
jgi:hypothetical protein